MQTGKRYENYPQKSKNSWRSTSPISRLSSAFFLYFINKTLGLSGHLTWIVISGVNDLLHGFGATYAVEGGFTAEETVGSHTYAQNIHAAVVALAVYNLGRNVVQGAAVSRPSVFENGRPPEIT